MYNVQCNLTFAGTCSIITLVFIAYDRYHVIVYGIAHADQRITTRKAALIIAFIWIYSVVACIPPFFGWGGYKLGNSTYRASRMLQVTPSHITSLDVTPSEAFTSGHLREVTHSGSFTFRSYTFRFFTFGTLQLCKITPSKTAKGVTSQR